MHQGCTRICTSRPLKLSPRDRLTLGSFDSRPSFALPPPTTRTSRREHRHALRRERLSINCSIVAARARLRGANEQAGNMKSSPQSIWRRRLDPLSREIHSTHPAPHADRFEIHLRMDDQWSHSPPIMLAEPKIGTISESMPPSIRAPTPCVTAKHGGRMRTRYGVPLPSDTR